METNPSYYNLPARIQLDRISSKIIGIRKLVKGRIVQKDAEKILEIARQIISVAPELEVVLICTKNICSKSIRLLEENKIGIQYVEVN